MSLLARVLLAIVGLLFLVAALRGIYDPSFFTQTFGVEGEGMGRNTLRADFGAFFLVGAVPTVWVALQPGRVRWLIVPLLFLATVFVLRLFGVVMGDVPDTTGLVAEAISILVILTAQRVLSHDMTGANGISGQR